MDINYDHLFALAIRVGYVKTSDIRYALLWVAKNGHETLAKLLLGLSAGVNEVDEGGLTPVVLAARHRHKSLVRLMLGKGKV